MSSSISLIRVIPTEIRANPAFGERWDVQEELNRLAGEIHDGLTQHLSAICLQLLVAKEIITSSRGDPLDNIQQAIELANLGLVETRHFVHNLRHGAVNKSRLTEALQGLAERWNVPGRLRCDFRSENVPEDRLSDTSKHQLLRIGQEAIHNSVRHANPTRIAISLRRDTRTVILEIRDNGLGISASRLGKCGGLGLGSMKKRAREIGGRLEIKTAPSQGTSIVVTIPFPR